MVIWNVSFEFVSRKLGSRAPQLRRTDLASSIRMSCAGGCDYRNGCRAVIIEMQRGLGG